MAKPLVLTKENVLATMEGRKTMTRRIISDNRLQNVPWDGISYIMNNPPHQHSGKWYYDLQSKVDDTDHIEIKPKYQVGDEVYVAEGYQITSFQVNPEYGFKGKYLADGKEFVIPPTKHESNLWIKRKFPHRPTSGRFMYKSLARTFMRITEVKVERLQSISNEDVKAEGVIVRNIGETPYRAFKTLWDSIHGDRAWDLNPWVFGYRWELIRNV